MSYFEMIICKSYFAIFFIEITILWITYIGNDNLIAQPEICKLERVKYNVTQLISKISQWKFILKHY